MTAAVLCIGTEITRGEIVNTNATWLASKLTDAGFEVTEIASVDDDRGRIIAALRRLASQHTVIVCTGGLGPTTDDLTAESAALAAGMPMVRDAHSVAEIRDRFARLGRSMVASNIKQADFPSGAKVLDNAVGTAPGFAVTIGAAAAYFFPGVPREMQHIWSEHVDPALRALAPANTFQLRIKTFGKPESTVGELLDGVEHRYPGVTIGYRATFPEIEVKVFTRAASQDAARIIALSAAQEVRQRLGAIVFGYGDDTFVDAVATLLRARGLTLATAESCTGGLIGHLLTSRPASDFFKGGLVTYANEAKVALLGVPAEQIEQYGAVSDQVAMAMAMGAVKVTGADVGLAVTGIAGPTGGSAEKPVGLVHWAVAHAGGVESRHRVFPGDRTRIQKFAAYAALALVRELIESPTEAPVLPV